MTTQAAAEPQTTEAARAAGRGGLAIAVAKISFVLVGLVQQIVFPRVLDEAGYGAVSRMLSVVSIVNNVIVASSLQGVSRMVNAARPGEEEVTVRKTLLVHAVLAVIVSCVFALSASAIADLVGAPHAATPIRIGAGVVLCYGVYAPLVGALNGRRRFLDQAGLDIFYGVSRTATMTVAAWLFARVLGLDAALGAALGFVTAATLIVPIAMWRSGVGRRGAGGPSSASYLRFLLPLIAANIGLNLLLQLDLLILSSSAGAQAASLGLDAKAADALLAPYRSVQLFAFLPYQLLMSVQFVLFPLLSKVSADKDTAGVRDLTRKGVRIAFVLTGLIAGTIAALGPHLLRLVFPIGYATSGAPFVRIYVLGLASLAILGIATAALASLRKEVWGIGATWLAAISVGVGILATRPDAFGPELWMASARAAAAGVTFAAIVAGALVYRAAGAFVPAATAARVVLAVALTVLAGTYTPWLGKPAVLVQAALMAVLYLVILVGTREIGRADLALVRAVLRRGT